jgi:hypothetical protein
MKLIIIYGPPASGKLSVAKELAKITGYKLFHNHLTSDLAGTIFERRTEPYTNLVNKWRLEMLEAAAKYKVSGVIFTFVYSHKIDDAYIRKLIGLVEKHKGKVLLVNLLCENKELLKRVGGLSRKGYGKVRSKKALKETLKETELLKPMPHKKNFKINNTKISAKKVAKLIKEHYRIK